jgi:uncharacterized protein (DUF58 family)
VKWPRLLQLRPTAKLLSSVSFAVGLALIIGFARIFYTELAWVDSMSRLFTFSALGLAVLVVYDALNRGPDEQLRLVRNLPTSFALNREQSIVIELSNFSDVQLKVTMSDSVPSNFHGAAFPLRQEIGLEKRGLFEYTVIPKSRGPAVFQPAYVLIESAYGFWQFVYRLGEQDQTKVYPDFSAISNSSIFGVEQAMRNMGAHVGKRKGSGMEFNQLREFREGDTLKQIDWKASAKLGSPISREYQQEKDQNVIFLLDCSRRMRAIENNLSYFDYALNALLMSSYIALDKGDAVGVMTFSGEPSWLPPIKGKGSINTLLNHLYALDTSTQSSDYVTAAENLLLKHRKRSLIILLTNVRDEDSEDLQKAVDILTKQHLVMVVALQERLLEKVDDMPVEKIADALLYAGTKHFQLNRQKMLALLKARGVSVVDATHKNIHIQLVTEYMRLKQFGKI